MAAIQLIPNINAAADDALASAVAQSLETMAFICVEPRPGVEPPLDGGCRVDVEFFSGAVDGKLQLFTTLALGEAIAATLSEDGRLNDEGGADSLKEMANVVCGLALKNLPGVVPVDGLTLRPPTLTRDDPWSAAPDGHDVAAIATMDAEGHPLVARLVVTRGDSLARSVR